MLKTLMSRFADTQILVGGNCQAQLEGLLSGLAAHEDASKAFDAQMSMGDDYWLPADNWMSRYQPYKVVNGILQIPIKGVLLHDFPWQFGSLATGYQYIQKAWERGEQDGSVRGIAFIEHSPGGEVAGCFDLVERIVAGKTKTIRAFAHEAAYSAAYALATAADHIAVSRTGGVGSIGVVTSHVDLSKMMEDMGVKVTFVQFGKHKTDGNPYGPIPADVLARWQARVNELGEMFVALVAKNRGLDEKAIRDTEALTYSARDAVSIGLADSIGPLDDSMAAFSADLSQTEGDEQMSEKDTATAEQAITAARAEGHAEGITQGKAEGFAEGVTAERARINTILGSDVGKARPKAALSAALKTDMTAEQAEAFLSDLAEENPAAAEADKPDEKANAGNNAQNFDAAMSRDNPDVGADVGGGENAKGDELSTLAKNFGLAGY